MHTLKFSLHHSICQSIPQNPQGESKATRNPGTILAISTQILPPRSLSRLRWFNGVKARQLQKFKAELSQLPLGSNSNLRQDCQMKLALPNLLSQGACPLLQCGLEL